MDLYRLPADAAMQRPAERGWTIGISRGPVTVAEVLQAASDRMDAEDELLERERDPLAWMRAHRPRRLIDRLLGRR